MKRVLMIDCDTDRAETIRIGPIQEDDKEKILPDPLLDMKVLCEAVCTMIHVCHQADIQKDTISVRECIDHIQKGFAEAGYKGILTAKAKKEMKKETSGKKETDIPRETRIGFTIFLRLTMNLFSKFFHLL